MRISDWSSDVCSSDLLGPGACAYVRQQEPFALIAILLLSSSYAVGYWTRGGSSVVPPRLVAKWAKEVEQQRAALGTAREAAEQNDAALSRRLAELQAQRSEEHTSELQSLMRISYAVFCLKKKKIKPNDKPTDIHHR